VHRVALSSPGLRIDDDVVDSFQGLVEGVALLVHEQWLREGVGP
jgi:hypothetical protein